jgi:hypothetical protein
MLKKTIVSFFYFLQYYNNDAFTPPFFHVKNNNLHHLFNSNNNDFEKTDFERNDIKKNDFEKKEFEKEEFESKPFNRNIRLGRSKDEDGKSNIWSVEPKMEVVDEEMTELNKNILTGGLIITGFLATLPLLYVLNQYVKNIDY